MMLMQWSILIRYVNVPGWNLKVLFLMKIFVVNVDWNSVWKDNILSLIHI